MATIPLYLSSVISSSASSSSSASGTTTPFPSSSPTNSISSASITSASGRNRPEPPPTKPKSTWLRDRNNSQTDAAAMRHAGGALNLSNQDEEALLVSNVPLIGGGGFGGGGFYHHSSSSSSSTSSFNREDFTSGSRKPTAPPLPPRRPATGSSTELVPPSASFHSTINSPLSERARTASSPSRSTYHQNNPPQPSSATPLPFSNHLPTITPRVANAALAFKDRFVASAGGIAGGIGREWGKKGKGKLQEKLARRNSGGYPTPSNQTFTQGGSTSMTTTSSADYKSSTLSHQPSPMGATDNPIKLPTTILGVKVPKRSGIAFGVPLEEVVERTRIADLDGPESRRKNLDEVLGDDARKWMPAVAVRCFEYLEEWGRREEGIYRVPGSSYQIAQLRALFDAGCDLDLREIPPSDLDPHAVASVFKSWLREIPDSLLSNNLDSAIDHLVLTSTGFRASSAHFLSSSPPSALAGPGMVNGRPPPELLDKLTSLFCDAMPAEEYYLLRALAYHLARLSSCADVNKMTLANLRLILSPTVKLSPGFLGILVAEREIFFSRPNESARLRSATIGLTSFRASSSSLSGSSSQPALSPRSTPYTSPTLPSAEFTPRPNKRGSWQLVDSPPAHHTSFSTSPPSSNSPSPDVRTPIADRFASSSQDAFPSPPVSPNPKSSSVFPNTPASSYVPVRSPGAGTFFSSREVAMPNPPSPVSVRNEAKVAVKPSEKGRVMTLQDAIKEREKGRSQSVDILMGYENKGKRPDSFEEEVLTPRQGEQGRKKFEEEHRWPPPAEDKLSDSGSEGGRPSFESSFSEVSRSTGSSNSGSVGKSSRAAKRQSRLFISSTASIPKLNLPTELTEEAEGDGDGWGLLSVEERKRFFQS